MMHCPICTKDMSAEDREQAKLVIPRVMEVLNKMDNEANSGKRDSNAFTIEEVYRETGLHSITPETMRKLIRHCSGLDGSLLDIDENETVNLTAKGRT
jgi:hypothetical protein